MAGRSDDAARCRDQRGDCRPPLRTRRTAAPAGAPVLVPVVGAVMCMDYHSSGITTSVVGALKRGLEPLSSELGIHVCGGRGAHSRRTPHELHDIGARVGFDGAELAAASRLVAKVDSAAVQDGFDLYLHGFIVTDDGHWAVVQQGMNADRRQARRYHWLSEGLTSFVDAPHAAIAGEPQGEIVNLADRRGRSFAPRPTRPAGLAGAGPDRARDAWVVGDASCTTRSAAIAASGHASASRCARGRGQSPAAARDVGRGRGCRPEGFCRTAAEPWYRRPYGAVAGDGRRDRPWRALPICRPGAVFPRSWR